MVELDDRPAETAAREADLDRAAVEVDLLVLDLFIALDAGPLLRRAGLCAAAQPLELVAQEVLALLLAGLLALDARFLLLEERRVVARVGVGTALVELEDLRRRVVEEVAVVRDHQQGALLPPEIFLEPGDCLAVEMVRRLVEEQEVARLYQGRREGQALLLAARERAGLGRVVRDAELLQHGLGRALDLPAVELVNLLGVLHDALLDGGAIRIFCRIGQRELVAAQGVHQGRHAAEDLHEHRVLRVEDLVLREVLDAQAAHRDHRAVIDGHEPRDGLEERRLARAVDTDDADLVPRVHA